MDFDEFIDLELLAEQPLDFDVDTILTGRAADYSNIPLHELFELLENAVESYTLVQPTLALALQRSAEREIEFLLELLQERLNSLLKPVRPTQPVSYFQRPVQIAS
ncbi:MAG: hypothetical protein ACKO7W_03510 [Elainella sp.]